MDGEPPPSSTKNDRQKDRTTDRVKEKKKRTDRQTVIDRITNGMIYRAKDRMTDIHYRNKYLENVGP